MRHNAFFSFVSYKSVRELKRENEVTTHTFTYLKWIKREFSAFEVGNSDAIYIAIELFAETFETLTHTKRTST